MLGYLLAYLALGLPIAVYAAYVAIAVDILNMKNDTNIILVFVLSWLLFPLVLLWAVARLLLNLLPFEFVVRKKP